MEEGVLIFVVEDEIEGVNACVDTIVVGLRVLRGVGVSEVGDVVGKG